jgi:predicted ferric reductase
MKINRGRIFIILSMVFTALLWWLAIPKDTISVLDQLSHLIAGLSLTGLCMVFVLSTRNKTLEKWMGGLDNVYKDHKWLAIVSVVLIFIHGRMSESIAEAEAIGEVIKSTSALLGTLGQLLFILLTVIALFAKRLQYENWRFIHRLMVIPYLFGIYHSYVSSKYDLFTMTPLALWVGLTTIIGIVAGIYTILFYQKTGFNYGGNVSSVEYLNENIVEIELVLDLPIDFFSGQYIFIKIIQKGIEKAPHPYTIARGEGNKIYLAIKKLGDGTTDLYDNLVTGAKIKVDGPYGQFDFKQGKEKQVWIAGGIGITAFISYLERENTDRGIELFYTYRGEKEGVYKSFLETYEKEHSNFNVHFNDTSKMDRLELKDNQVEGDITVYMCGPEKMIKHYNKSIKSLKQSVDIRYEVFGFAR